jgi:GntR family transcriptional regulator, transcriptional repressor for pyruvate dehydrogenase complex
MLRSTVTAPIRVTLVESLAQQIVALIQQERLQPGDRLPSVRDLAPRLGVAVPTIREAIRRLEAFGVVEVRHGSGMYVRSAQPRVMLANPGIGAIDGQVVLDLIDARLLFEPYCAERAAHTPESTGVARLAALLAEAEREIGRDDRALTRANMAFHAGVAQCAGNVVLAQVMETLAELHKSEQAAMLWLGNAREEDHREHKAILAAIRAGDPKQARELMRKHLLGVRNLMAARLAELAHARKVRWLDATREAERTGASSWPSNEPPDQTVKTGA